MDSLPRINLRVNTVDAVAHQLRAELVHGTIRPGERIRPKELAKRFSVSHIPVREALRRLEAEDLVSATSHGATYATEVRQEDIDGIYDLRSVVEGEFASRSARVRTDDDVKDVRRILAQLERLDPYGSEFYSVHRDFHWALLSPAADYVIRRVLDRLWRTTDRHLAVAVTTDPQFPAERHAQARTREHRKLVARFASGDADNLRLSIEAHLGSSRRRLRLSYVPDEREANVER
jgi:DNA-binding GntR family transcriptional regulator